MGIGFLDVGQSVVHTSQGNVGLPILYRKTVAATALFAVPQARAAALLADTGLQAVQTRRGEALVAIAFFRYDETSIGPYNEAATAVLVTRAGQSSPASALAQLALPVPLRRAAMRILDLPVTTAIANAAGREIWGLPKFVTAIPFTLEQGRLDAAVQDPADGSPIVTLQGETGPGLPSPGADLLLYSHLHGELLRTRISVRALQYLHRGDGLVLRVGSSPHPMAERLRALGLDGATPRLVQTSTRFRSRLPAGERLEKRG